MSRFDLCSRSQYNHVQSQIFRENSRALSAQVSDPVVAALRQEYHLGPRRSQSSGNEPTPSLTSVLCRGCIPASVFGLFTGICLFLLVTGIRVFLRQPSAQAYHACPRFTPYFSDDADPLLADEETGVVSRLRGYGSLRLRALPVRSLLI